MHSWLHRVHATALPGSGDESVTALTGQIMSWLKSAGNVVTLHPIPATNVILTTATFGKPVPLECAPFFNAKRRHRLITRPTVVTLVGMRSDEFKDWTEHFANLSAIRRTYPGLGSEAGRILADQSRTAGPEVALGRLIQAQTKSIRAIVLVYGDNARPLQAVHYSLAGAHRVTSADNLDEFVRDAGIRILTAACEREVHKCAYVSEPLPLRTWNALTVPSAMIRAGKRFGELGLFSSPVSIETLLGFRGLGDVLSRQFSDGCYAAFEPTISALVVTATGSWRSIDKAAIGQSEQAIVVGVEDASASVRVQPVEGFGRIPPSIEALEMVGICRAGGSHEVRDSEGLSASVPNVRAILHAHRGVDAFNPQRVERIVLDEMFEVFPVSCGTLPLAEASADAFRRSVALRDDHDPRLIVFLEQPGHGVILVEKWSEEREPFDAIHHALVSGDLVLSKRVPQGESKWDESRISTESTRLVKVFDGTETYEA